MTQSEDSSKLQTLIAAARCDAESIEAETTLGGRRPSGLAADPFEAAPPPGYRIEAEIHRGAQGVVYRAVHERTRRQVAIKAIWAAPLTALRDAERFEREVEALRRVDDPRVVSIHDCGVTAGCFFLVMDCVDGAPVDRFVRERGLSVREKIGLLAEICEAVHSAHVKGVIHRDIKPGNLLIDAEGRPHVLDFGLAKFLGEGDRGARDGVTRTGQFVGSLPWASPEQVDGLPGAVDLRSDVYSLGVVMFQVLTGSFPYELPEGLRPALETIARTPPRRPRELCRALDDEIESIVLKCLGKVPERRYQSAGELARDLRRYLAGEPVEAKRDKGSYMIRKFVHRYRGSVAVAFLFLVGILMFAVSVSYLWNKAAQERDIAMQAQQRALEQSQRAIEAERRADAVAEFLQQMLASVDPQSTPGREVTVREVLEQAAARTRDVDAAPDPTVRAEIQQTLGRSFEELGLFERAEALYWAQVTTRIQEAARGIEDEALEAQIRALAGESAPSDELIAQAGQVVDAINARREMTTDRAAAIADGLAAIGSAQRSRRRLEVSERTFRKGLEMAEDGRPDDPMFALDCRLKLAAIAGSLGRPEEAIALAEEALRKAKASKGLYNGELSIAYSTLGHLLQQAGRADAAREAFERAAGEAKDAKDDLKAGAIADCMGSLWREARKFERSAEYYRSAVEHFEKLGDSGWSRSSNTRCSLAWVYAELGEGEKANQLFEQVLAESRARSGGSYSPSAFALTQLVQYRMFEGRLKEAEELLVDGVRAVSKLGDSAVQNIRGSVGILIKKYRAAGDADAAARCEKMLEALP